MNQTLNRKYVDALELIGEKDRVIQVWAIHVDSSR
jgi:hypothetical protein